MPDTTSNNKRIAKNTMFLYFRMILIMLVQFYAVRITLKYLGVVDYGIYNLVGGITSMFTFLTHTMTSASQRFFAYDIGKGNEANLKITFDSIWIIFIILGVISILFLEFFGVLLIDYKLVIPDDRIYAAKIIFHVSVLTLFITIFTLPFNSLIIAHEEMKTFAFVSIIEAILKLAIVYCLVIVDTDKLILYSILILCVQVSVSFVYIFICFKRYQECDRHITFDNKITKQIVPFMSWNLIGGVSSMLFSHGLTIMINIFFGPIANTSKAISDKLNHTVNNFVSNFMIAAQPQIVKTYANKEYDAMHNLVYLSSRISFYLIMVLSLPILFNTVSLLSIWLGEIDDLTVMMVRLMFVFSMIGALENPINYSIRATGDIKNYQIFVGLITLCVLPLSYMFFKIGLPAYYGYVALLIVYGLAFIVRLFFLKKQIGISYMDYIHNIIMRIFPSIMVSVFLSFLVSIFVNENSLFLSLLRIFVMFIVSFLTVLLLGLNSQERRMVKSIIKK